MVSDVSIAPQLVRITAVAENTSYPLSAMSQTSMAQEHNSLIYHNNILVLNHEAGYFSQIF